MENKQIIFPEINKAALARYIEKYKHLIRDEKLYALIEKLKNELL